MIKEHNERSVCVPGTPMTGPLKTETFHTHSYLHGHRVRQYTNCWDLSDLSYNNTANMDLFACSWVLLKNVATQWNMLVNIILIVVSIAL